MHIIKPFSADLYSECHPFFPVIIIITFADTEKIRSIGLDVPQTCMLAKMLKEDGINLKNDLLSIDELVENIDDLLKGQ